MNISNKNISAVYPKVLIVGESFHTHSGGGITQSNLFRYWPKENIAIIPYSKNGSDPRIYNKIYSLYEKEIIYLFPFNLLKETSQFFQKIINKIQLSNLIFKFKQNNKSQFKPNTPTSSNGNNDYTNVTKRSKNITNIYNFVNNSFGIKHIKFKIIVSQELLKWIADFNPDLIYAQFSTLETIRFISNLRRQTNIPLVIHFMDDWPSVLASSGVFHQYWSCLINKELKSLIATATTCIAISDKMSKEFKTRYNREFAYFHNPVEIEKWLTYSKTNWEIGASFKVLYAGRVNGSIIKNIKNIVNSIQKLIFKNHEIEFHIYTKDFLEMELLFREKKGIFVHKPIPDYSELPKLFSSYDLLVIPIDFDTQFLTLSMPTKVSEYMISGTPILVYAPKDTALAEYALNYQWGYVISNNEETEIENAILTFFKNEPIRRKYGLKAKELAISRHNAEKVRTEFRMLLNSQTKYMSKIDNTL